MRHDSQSKPSTRLNTRSGTANSPRRQPRNIQQPIISDSYQAQERKALNARTKARLTQSKTEEKAGRKKPIPADKQLKVIGHQLKPCIMLSESSIVEEALSENIIKEAKSRLNDHELIKVKIRFTDRDDRRQALDLLLEATDARAVHVIGKIALIFKASSRFSEKLSNIERHRQLV